jgi:hypothetical protein
MAYIQSKSASDYPERKLSIVLEYVPGKVTDTLDRLIALYQCITLLLFLFRDCRNKGKKDLADRKGSNGEC